MRADPMSGDRMSADRMSADPMSVDALIAAAAPGVRPPTVTRRDVVLVTGPWLAGASSVCEILARRLPELQVVEAGALRHGEVATLTVFVASATAPLTPSDRALLERAAAATDAVVAVVTKIDVHRRWREVLEANSAVPVGAGRVIRWVGAAAAPDLGEPRVDELVEAVGVVLADPDLPRRNRLRAWEDRLAAEAGALRRDADGVGRAAAVAALGVERTELLRSARRDRTERAVTLRTGLGAARIELGSLARNRAAALRDELAADAAAVTRRRLAGFEPAARERGHRLLAEVDDAIAARVAEIAAGVGLPVPPAPGEQADGPRCGPPGWRAGGLEGRLMLVLGAGFGLGLALTLSRLLAGLAPGLAVAGAVLAALAGAAASGWVVAGRRLLRDRAMLTGWSATLAAAVRACADQRIAAGLLAAEAWLTRELARDEDERAAATAAALADVVAGLRQHALAGARATALAERRLPDLQAALVLVRAELCRAAGAPEESAAGAAAESAAGATESTAVDEMWRTESFM
ncbi:hypothetical protein AWC04_00860 [Mycolicibacterium fallax]|uniref:Uncharacterized protein n=2 Tax=Mycolicibacterium fallax TaxID=1793 RepID=A0A1X1RNB5_MYCFA|nr:hypothetical protein AWC04_00860 [Mycolicibacterium fallax]